MGTHHGAVSHEHLDYYLDEFTFRFNRRLARARRLNSRRKGFGNRLQILR
jgi:hypothetical protein